VPELEVLVGKLLAIDGLAAGALHMLASCPYMPSLRLTLPRVKSPP